VSASPYGNRPIKYKHPQGVGEFTPKKTERYLKKKKKKQKQKQRESKHPRERERERECYTSRSIERIREFEIREGRRVTLQINIDRERSVGERAEEKQ
jgi:hypothetical protein